MKLPVCRACLSCLFVVPVCRACLSCLFICLLSVVANGATIYVDANAADAGNGSVGSPFNKFVDALAEAGDGDTILVKGGEGQVYDDYPYTISQENLTIEGYGSGKPLFQMTGASIGGGNGAFNVSAQGLRMAGLSFYGNNKAYGYQSFLVRLEAGAHNAVFENNHFEWDPSHNIRVSAAIGRTGFSQDGGLVTNVVARNNVIKNCSNSDAKEIFLLGDNAQVIGNLFSNTCTAVSINSYSLVVSNIIINSNCKNGALCHGGYGSGRSATIAFNTVYQNNGVTNPAIQKNRDGFNAGASLEPTRIFNNTVIGASSLIRCEPNNVNGSRWEPVIVNNIAYGTSNIVDISGIINPSDYGGETIFGPNTIIQNNLFASDVDEVFEERVTLLCADNVFNNSDHRVTFWETGDFYSEKYFVPHAMDLEYINAGYGTPENGYVKWIGAKPCYIPAGTIFMFR